jgi:hypothetical protein
VWAQTSARARIGGTPTAPVTLANFGGACIRAAGIAPDKPSLAIDSGTSTTPGVFLSGCGGTAAIVLDTPVVTSTIDKIVINRGATLSGGIVVRQAHTLNASNVTINNVLGPGILVTNNAVLTLDKSSVFSTAGVGVSLTDGANGTISSLTARGNMSDGLRCEGTSKLTLRGSELTVNSGNGLLIAGGCGADVNSTIFNRTTAKNGGAGLCFNSTAAPPSASSSTWSCKIMSGCSSTTTDLPSRAVPGGAVGCAAGADISEPMLLTVTASGATCCY